MKNITIILLIVIAAFISSCEETHTENTHSTTTSSSETKEVISRVSVAEFEKLIENKTGVLLDVRTPGENKAGHIDGSTLINVNNVNFKSSLASLDKNIPVMVYCRSGARSMKAAKILKANGFTKVYNLDGGFNAWSSKH